jgi:hypothetical protein
MVQKGLHVPVLGELIISINNTIEYVDIEELRVPVIGLNISVLILNLSVECEKLRGLVINTLWGKISLWQAGWQCVVREVNFVCLWYFPSGYARRVYIYSRSDTDLLYYAS